MTIPAQPGLIRREAQEIVAQAEAAMHRLEWDEACEGQRLMATQILAALRHLDRIIGHHHDHLAHATPAATADQPVVRKHTWWIGALWIARSGARNRTSAIPQAVCTSVAGSVSTGLRPRSG